MSRRGHVLGLVLMVAVVAATLVGVFLTRHLAMIDARRSEAARTQAMTLARTACAAQKTGEVKTEAGPAQVSRVGSVVTVKLGGVLVTQDCVSGRTEVQR